MDNAHVIFSDLLFQWGGGGIGGGVCGTITPSIRLKHNIIYNVQKWVRHQGHPIIQLLFLQKAWRLYY